MEKVKLGTRVTSLGINRANVAEGMKGKGILLEKDPRFKNLAYDESVQRYVEVDQDLVIKYRLNPISKYYFLIARLNTDMKGQIIGDDFVIEYTQLSDTQYTEYLDGIEAIGGPTTPSGVLLTKVSKSVDGKDFSYVKTLPANIPMSENLKKKIKEIRVNKAALESMWIMVDSNTSITVTEYEKLKLEKAKEFGTEGTMALPKKNVQKIEASSDDSFAVESPDFEEDTFEDEDKDVEPVEVKPKPKKNKGAKEETEHIEAEACEVVDEFEEQDEFEEES